MQYLSDHNAPLTCEDGWHVSRPWAKRCDCGERTNPSYRTWWQRRADRRDRKRRVRRARRRSNGLGF